MGKWTLSEFLNLLELRSQYWCFVELSENSGFAVPHTDNVYFYALMQGRVELSGTLSKSISLTAGDILIVLSGEAHAIRTEIGASTSWLDYFGEGMPVDIPPKFSLGQGEQVARLMCGKLKVRWPFGQRPKAIPLAYKVQATESPVNLNNLEALSSVNGGASVLTRAASLIAAMAFQDQAESEKGFLGFVASNPVDCVKQYIEKHPFSDWTVADLAAKVGVGRSTLAARFTADVGITPMEYVTIERMKLAENLLKTSDLKISDISQRVGYRSEAAFSRRFTLYFGVSPGRMRKQIQKKILDESNNEVCASPEGQVRPSDVRN